MLAVSFFSSPKRRAFLLRLCDQHGLPVVTLQNVCGPRWVASTRNLLSAVVNGLQTFRFVLATIKDSQWLRTASKGDNTLIQQVESWTKALSKHWFLESVHFMLDVRNVHAWFSKTGEGEGGDCVSLVAARRALPKWLHRLKEPENCKALMHYRNSITVRDDGGEPVHSIIAWQRQVPNVDDAEEPRLITETHVLKDFKKTAKALSRERVSMLDEIMGRVPDMKVSPRRAAMEALFNSKRYNFAELRVNGTSCEPPRRQLTAWPHCCPVGP